MFKDKSVLAVIPARSGSKGLKNKNLRVLKGKNLVVWPIEAALKSKVIDRVVCSTDSSKIASVAQKHGAQVPFLRPANLALDTTPTSDVILHVINYFETIGERFDYILLLEPTSPLTNADDVLAVLNLLYNNEKNADSIVSISPNVIGHPDFTFLLSPNNGFLQPVSTSSGITWQHKRRQDISNCYYLDGSVYLSKVETFKQFQTFIHGTTLGIEFSKWKSFEIDDEIDFKIISMIINDEEITNGVCYGE